MSTLIKYNNEKFDAVKHFTLNRFEVTNNKVILDVTCFGNLMDKFFESITYTQTIEIDLEEYKGTYINIDFKLNYDIASDDFLKFNILVEEEPDNPLSILANINQRYYRIGKLAVEEDGKTFTLLLNTNVLEDFSLPSGLTVVNMDSSDFATHSYYMNKYSDVVKQFFKMFSIKRKLLARIDIYDSVSYIENQVDILAGLLSYTIDATKTTPNLSSNDLIELTNKMLDSNISSLSHKTKVSLVKALEEVKTNTTKFKAEFYEDKNNVTVR